MLVSHDWELWLFSVLRANYGRAEVAIKGSDNDRKNAHIRLLQKPNSGNGHLAVSIFLSLTN